MIAVAAVNYARQLGQVVLDSAVSLYLYATCRRRAGG